MRNVLAAVVLLAALGAGLYVVGVDANPRFDDTGVLAGIIFVTSAMLSAIRPRAAVIIGLLVGLPIPVVESIRFGGVRGGVAALGFALACAFAGAYVGIVTRRSVQQDQRVARGPEGAGAGAPGAIDGTISGGGAREPYSDDPTVISEPIFPELRDRKEKRP